jgi:hypothetical protein
MDNLNEEMNLIGNPQFMGQQFGKVSVDQIRSLIKRQKRIKGYSHTAPVGNSQINLDLTGTARIFLGIAFFGKARVIPASPVAPTWTVFTDIETVQLQINNEIVIDQLDPNFLTPQFNNNEYYYLPRPLSGTDEITVKFNNTGTAIEEVKIVVYYI